MVARRNINGHSAYYNWDKEEWLYVDNDESASVKRPCITCKQYQTAEGHDHCIQNLPGVIQACCGHGVEEGYIRFENGKEFKGFFVEGDKK
jgi:hypothetical protein